ncbi:uncharacterized protein LOC115376424 isoform X5 [Myripristis murdjan]|uniref:uncharacterized protein LOC115376424 isoform X5 n=1 Tax=Myripristis murdjan TaxID=586833 RepID=UPI001175F533|nr:uncharacterized protein LOC115376424 isoform X5 [Myripristis murdjan]
MPSLFTTSCEAGVCCGLWTFCRVNFMWGGDDQHPAACCPDSLCLCIALCEGLQGLYITYKTVLSTQNLSMSSLQDEFTLTRTTSETDSSDFICPDSGATTLASISVKCSLVKTRVAVNACSTSLQPGFSPQLRRPSRQVGEGSLSSFDLDFVLQHFSS